MLTKILPPRIDNDYRGHPAGLVLFGIVVLIRILQSVMTIVTRGGVLVTADGIPLGSYPAAAAQTIVGAYTGYAIFRLALMLICVVVLIRYRAAIAAMFVVLLLQFLAAQVQYAMIPIPRTGTPPAGIMNRVLFGLMLVGFGLALWQPRRQPASDRASPA